MDVLKQIEVQEGKAPLNLQEYAAGDTQARPRYGVILLPRDISLPLELQAERTELEIGFGNGEYTAKYARAHPDVLLFGVEVSPACVLRCARRAAGLGNLRLIRADARLMMRELFADSALDRVTMNFPCPWPKRRHAHRRVTARDFADSLAAVLKPGGVFELVTDDAPYAQEARDRLGAHPALRLKNFEENPLRPVTTKYERKWLAEGKSIYRLTFVKTGNFTTQRHSWEGWDMHIRADRPATPDFMGSLNGVSGREGEARWAFGGYYAAPEGNAFLLETFSTDDEFEQRYYLRVSEGKPLKETAGTPSRGALVQLDRTAGAFLTPSVRGAVRDVADRLSGGVRA
ncbi:MAG: tRNA (guanosine(46)-N7)-methyltransferase TrmB [Fretibacterium sp.]|nr:tRNA (guanosine(46)-N7)-methyltransferase TrmB [Fretibacterium sp.]